MGVTVTVFSALPVVAVSTPAPLRVAVSSNLLPIATPGPGPTDQQIADAVAAYLQANPPEAGGGVTDQQVAAAVAAYLVAFPPKQGEPGTNATPAQVQAAVDAYLAAHPIEVPDPLPPSAGQVQDAVATYLAANPVPGPTLSQVNQAVSAWLAANPPQDGKDATPEQIAAAVAAYLADNPPEDGDNATPEQIAFAVAQYMAANPVEAEAPTAGQVQTAVTAYLQANPVPGPSQGQVAQAVGEWLEANPPQDGKNATPEQIAVAVADYIAANPVEPEGPTDMQVAAAVAAYLAENPPAADSEQVNALIDAYFSGDRALRESMKDAPNGVATLDASGSIVQRIKSAANSTPVALRDTGGEGNGKASLFTASIATDGQSHALVRTGVWRGELSYSFRVSGPAGDGFVCLQIYRTVVNGATFYGYTNLGTIPVIVTYGMFSNGYSGFCWQGDFGRAQFVVTEVMVVGNGTDDAAVRDWMMFSANDTGMLAQQVTVPLRVMGG